MKFIRIFKKIVIAVMLVSFGVVRENQIGVNADDRAFIHQTVPDNKRFLLAFFGVHADVVSFDQRIDGFDDVVFGEFDVIFHIETLPNVQFFSILLHARPFVNDIL